MLQAFGSDIWIAEGEPVSFYGFAYPTRMAIMRLRSGALFVWSPIALTNALRSEVDTLGSVRYLVSPNKLHHIFLDAWKQAYPAAKLYAPPGLRKKRKDIAFDDELGDAPPQAWAGEIDQVIVHGSFFLTEVVFFHNESQTVLFADLIQNFRPGWFKGWKGVVARLDGITTFDPGAPREWRASFLNRRAAGTALERILAWSSTRLIIAHGELPPGDPNAFISKCFAWLLGKPATTRP